MEFGSGEMSLFGELRLEPDALGVVGVEGARSRWSACSFSAELGNVSAGFRPDKIFTFGVMGVNGGEMVWDMADVWENESVDDEDIDVSLKQAAGWWDAILARSVLAMAALSPPFR